MVYPRKRWIVGGLFLGLTAFIGVRIALSATARYTIRTAVEARWVHQARGAAELPELPQECETFSRYGCFVHLIEKKQSLSEMSPVARTLRLGASTLFLLKEKSEKARPLAEIQADLAFESFAVYEAELENPVSAASLGFLERWSDAAEVLELTKVEVSFQKKLVAKLKTGLTEKLDLLERAPAREFATGPCAQTAARLAEVRKKFQALEPQYEKVMAQVGAPMPETRGGGLMSEI